MHISVDLYIVYMHAMYVTFSIMSMMPLLCYLYDLFVVPTFSAKCNVRFLVKVLWLYIVGCSIHRLCTLFKNVFSECLCVLSET